MRRFIVHFVFDDTPDDEVADMFECTAFTVLGAHSLCEAAHPGCNVLYVTELDAD